MSQIIYKSGTIYAVNKAGKPKMYFSEATLNDDFSVTMVRYSGQVGGKMRTQTSTISKGKNIGKANETSATQQAVLELKSHNAKKYIEGYKTASYYITSYNLKHPKQNLVDSVYDTNIPDKLVGEIIVELGVIMNTDHNNRLKPMLAEKYKGSKKDKFQFPAFAQPKYNGMRCIASVRGGKVELRSREGESINLPHIQEQLRLCVTFIHMAKMYNLELDGELYVHGMPLQDIIHNVRTTNLQTVEVKYMVYDILSDAKFLSRINWLTNAFHAQDLANNNFNIVVSETVNIKDEKEALEYFRLCRQEDYEGAMLRNRNSLYEFGFRSNDLLKLKETLSAEFPIVGASLKHGSDDSDFVWECKTSRGLVFQVKPHGTVEQREEYYSKRNTYIGKLLQLSFYEYTKDKIPFHITEVTVRDYE